MKSAKIIPIDSSGNKIQETSTTKIAEAGPPAPNSRNLQQKLKLKNNQSGEKKIIHHI